MGATSTTAVLIDPTGERSFAHCVGAPKQMTKSLFMENLDLFAQSRMTLIGYYSLMPNLECDLAEVLAAIRETGCQTALDAAGDGGTHATAGRAAAASRRLRAQSGGGDASDRHRRSRRRSLTRFAPAGHRDCWVSSWARKGRCSVARAGEYLKIQQVTAPGAVVDTTGAGDCFYAGLLTGLLRGQTLEQAGRLAAATGACCVTALGASAGSARLRRNGATGGAGG